MQKATNATKVWICQTWLTNSRQNKLRRVLLIWVNFAGEPEVAGLQAAPSSDRPAQNRQRSDVVRWFNGSLHETASKCYRRIYVILETGILCLWKIRKHE